MDRRSPKSLWRDYGVPMQDPNAFSLQYYKDTTRDPSKPAKKPPVKPKKVDYTDHTGLLKIQKPKKAQEGTVLNSIYTKYPALRNMGEVTLKADTAFTKDKTGVGDIEYMGPQSDRDSVRYDGTGYRYAHPKMGTHGIIYNPNTNDEQSIMLDMLHGMPADSTYKNLRDEFKKYLLASKFNSDIEHRWNKKNEETKGENDGKDQYVDTEVDGAIRAMMVEGTPEYFQQHNYYPGARDEYYSDPNVKQSFEKIRDYIVGKKQQGGKMMGLLKKGGKVGNPKNRNKPGGSNVGKYSKSEGPFAGPSGGAPAGSYPIGSKARGKSALKLAHNAPNPAGIKAAVYRKYPDLKPGKALHGAKLGLMGMGRMQDKAPTPFKANAPVDKVDKNFKFTKKKRKEPKTAFAH